MTSASGSAPASLGLALQRAVQAQSFARTPDHWQNGKPVGPHPSIDLALVVFPAAGPPVGANVLFSREHPGGHVARIGPGGSSVQRLRFDADQRDAQDNSAAWLPGSDWRRLDWKPLHGAGALRFVAPYPASLLKLMVAVGVALAVDRGLAAWPDSLEPMIVVSSNEATDECVALLHRVGLLTPHADNPLNAIFAGWGLPTLQLNRTRPNGGWRNNDGAGVGQIHMTAWDTVRLLWLLDRQAPPPPWLARGEQAPVLPSAAVRERLHGVLKRQQLDEILSSGSLRDVPGWVQGGPDAPDFAHKTGTTDNYAADAGIVHTPGLHCIVAVLSSLGSRYAPHERCATTWKLPALGAAVHHIAQQVMGGNANAATTTKV